MKSIKELHEKAMDLAEFAFVAKLRGDLAQAEKLFRQAFKYESQAARLVHKVPSSRLTRAVLYRSAATLALDCNESREAQQLIVEGLAGHPPEEIAKELEEILILACSRPGVKPQPSNNWEDIVQRFALNETEKHCEYLLGMRGVIPA
jgi:hypothetical protein